MKTPYKNIYKVLGINRLIVIGSLVVTLIVSIFSLLMVKKIHNQSLNSAFAVNVDGSVMPMKLVEKTKNMEVEILNHLKLFHTYFYDLNPSNYEDNIDLALWIGDSSVNAVYKQKKADGVYNRLVQFGLIQSVIEVKSEIDIRKHPFKFRTKTVFEINRGTIVDKYELITSGMIISDGIDRSFPKNPHGLFITNFFEDQLKALKDED